MLRVVHLQILRRCAGTAKFKTYCASEKTVGAKFIWNTYFVLGMVQTTHPYRHKNRNWASTFESMFWGASQIRISIK